MSEITMEKLIWEGTDSSRMKFEGSMEWEIRFCGPVIECDDFSYCLKVHDIAGWWRTGGFMVGICEPDHPKKCCFGKTGTEKEYNGWGWNKGMGVWGTGCSNYKLKEFFKQGDEITVIVSKEEKTLQFLKNGEFMGKIDNLQLPKKLVIAAAMYDKVDFELTAFEGV